MSIGKIKHVEVFRRSFTLDSAMQSVVDVPSDNMPSGIIHGFTVRLECAALTGLGAAAADFQKILRSITYGAQTPKFNVMSSVPGKWWDRVLTTMLRRAPARVTPTTGGFSINYYLPFSWGGSDRNPALRKKDTALLNVQNKAQPFLNLILGNWGDLGTTISPNPSVVVVVEAHYEPNVRPGVLNPTDPTKSGDQPSRYLEISQKTKADISTNPIAQLITGGPRECIMLVVSEEDASGNEVSDIFNMGSSTPSKFEVTKGDSDGYTPRIKLAAWDNDMSDYFGITLPAGYHFFVAAAEGRLADTIALQDGGQFTVAADNLVTTASRVWKVGQFNTLTIPPDVQALQNAWLGVA